MLDISRKYPYIIYRKFERENFSKDKVMDYNHKYFSAKKCWVNRFNCFVSINKAFHYAGSIMYRVSVGAWPEEFVVASHECSKFSWD